jgi:hypothetical protein
VVGILRGAQNDVLRFGVGFSGLRGQFLGCGVVVLFAANGAVVLFCGFE